MRYRGRQIRKRNTTTAGNRKVLHAFYRRKVNKNFKVCSHLKIDACEGSSNEAIILPWGLYKLATLQSGLGILKYFHFDSVAFFASFVGNFVIKLKKV